MLNHVSMDPRAGSEPAPSWLEARCSSLNYLGIELLLRKPPVAHGPDPAEHIGLEQRMDYAFAPVRRCCACALAERSSDSCTSGQHSERVTQKDDLHDRPAHRRT